MKKSGLTKLSEDIKEIKQRINNKECHPVIGAKRTIGQIAADKLTAGMGSWVFILLFLAVLITWVFVNGFYLLRYAGGEPFDPFPFILLNLILSMLAAIQAPIIMMSQNRQAQKDRVKAEYDYAINRKSEREIQDVQKQLNRIESYLKTKKH